MKSDQFSRNIQKPLIDNKTLNINDIQDPILRFLETEAQNIINHPNLISVKKGTWIARVMELYDTPLPESIDPDLWERIRTGIWEIADTDRLVEFAKVARIISDPERLRYAKERLEDPDIPNTLEGLEKKKQDLWEKAHKNISRPT